MYVINSSKNYNNLEKILKGTGDNAEEILDKMLVWRI